jgi:hypothetical protein
MFVCGRSSSERGTERANERWKRTSREHVAQASSVGDIHWRCELSFGLILRSLKNENIFLILFFFEPKDKRTKNSDGSNERREATYINDRILSSITLDGERKERCSDALAKVCVCV